MNQEIFQPVRGTESSILAQTPQKGYVYFAIDTKKIFYSDGESFLPMGGNTGVWYGLMQYAETPEPTQVEFDFSIDEIEGNQDVVDGKYNVPNLDDLIFNTPDGCFYRVKEIDYEGESPLLHCNKLTVSGGGGGGGGGGGTGSAGSMTVSRLGDQTINTLQGNDCFIRYKFIATDASGEETGPGTASVYANGILKGTFVAQQGENEINVGPYLNIGTNSIRLVVSGSIGGTSNIQQSKNWTIISTNLALTWNYNETTINTASNITFDWTVSISLPHTTYIVVDGIYPISVPSVDNQLSKTYTVSRSQYYLTHGSHTVTMYAEAEIGGTIFRSAAISHTVICVDQGEASTIISVNIPENSSVDQYDTLTIPIIFYNPATAGSSNKVSATLREDGADVDRWEDYDNATLYEWNYTPTTPGIKTLSILSGTSEEHRTINVNDLGLSTSEVIGYDFKFKASDIISNNALRNWSYDREVASTYNVTHETIVPIFSQNFDWTNGGLKSELDSKGNRRNFISVKAGNTLSFNYAPLSNTSKAKGFTLKAIFKATECRDYDATIMTIGDPLQGDEVYLKLKANEGVFKSNNSIVTVPYCEDSYIEFEIDIWPNDQGSYLMTWIDGVPASASKYEMDDNFYQGSPKNIIIGSDDCDVQLYLLKVYQKHLSDEQHLTNFIMDAPNAVEVISRYNRNNILDNDGEISYTKLIEKNPDCDVYLYEISKMTQTKKDKIPNCTYMRFKGKRKNEIAPWQTAEGVEMAVQGTSSAAYGLAAFNFNSTFKKGFTDYSESDDGIHIDNWAMDENAIPINDYNTKVNVASCEGVNNALNQEWYERLVNHVYVTEYKKKNPKSRHTMQFMNMGVVFIKDNNPTTNANNTADNVFKDTPGYVQNPFYKMYSVCNMGNIKRNEGVFSDPSNPYDVIMENPDNQSIYQQMTGRVETNPETGELELYGDWDGAKFYPWVDAGSYFETEDSKAQVGKTYYARVEANGSISYTAVAVTAEVIGTDVSTYYEKNSNNEYELTSDTRAQANKTYYNRTVENDEAVFTEVTDIVLPVEGSSVSGYYEQATTKKLAATEVFEWRATPDDAWAAIKTSRGVDMEAEARKAWTDLVAWFAINNPNAATGNPLPQPVTYGTYTFKGYTSRADRVDVDGNTMPVYAQGQNGVPRSILAGLTISDYNGTYDRDTKEYRMAKMLHECEDHLIMDEIVFHYLFIERHALIDNVAKNTFWHTEDLQHWSMIKDYDNDTSDGNDNSGHLTLTYGYEVLDHVHHDPRESFVFNASSSVWLHFIDGLMPARVRMYQALDTSEIAAWDAEPYLKIFDEWQSKLPERVWIEDYYRKYLRPLEVYNATQFLPMLEGGKKTYQRKQFETYQEAYMSSEYFGRKCQSSLIDIRANGKDIYTMQFPMKMYADCYIRAAAGSGHDPNVRERYKRGEIANIQLPVRGDANDMTTYFYLAHYITHLSGIEQLKPKKVDISTAYRLKEFSMTTIGDESYFIKTEDQAIDSNKQYYVPTFNPVGSPSDDNITAYYEKTVNEEYIPTEDSAVIAGKTYYILASYVEVEEPNVSDLSKYFEEVISGQNLNLTTASFKANRMLEKLVVQDCPNITNSLDLSACTNLKYLDVRRSGFTGITLASNAPTETLLLNDPTTLSFDNLSRINVFEVGYSRLNTLFLNNIDNSPGVNSKSLVSGVVSQIDTILYDNQPTQRRRRLNYNLQNVQWSLNDANDLDSSLNIKLLDELLAELSTPYSGDSKIPSAQGLSGTLMIGSMAYSGTDSLTIYNKYVNKDTFPNLDINFESSNSKLYNISIVDGNGLEVWRKKAPTNYTITSEFLSSGPLGSYYDLSEITAKLPTASHVFEFTNTWSITDANTGTVVGTINNAVPLYNTPLSQDIVIIPIFNEQIRQYSVKFMNGDQIINADNQLYDYGTKINSIIPLTIPSKPDDDLDIYQTYSFLGYSLLPASNTPLVFTDRFEVNADLVYYAIYSDAVSVKNSINVNYDNFNYTLISTGYTDEADSQFNIPSGYEISPKSGLNLTGKITIPAYYQGLPIISIKGFGQFSNTSNEIQRNIKGIFFEEGTKIRQFMANAFAHMTNLKYLEIPDSLRVINERAIFDLSLKLTYNKGNTIYYLGSESSNLYKIGSYGFASCLDNDCTILYITPSLTKFECNTTYPNTDGSFGNFNYSYNLTTVYIGYEHTPSQLDRSDLNHHPFRLNPGTNITSVYLYVPNGVSTDGLATWINPFWYDTNYTINNITVSYPI